MQEAAPARAPAPVMLPTSSHNTPEAPPQVPETTSVHASHDDICHKVPGLVTDGDLHCRWGSMGMPAPCARQMCGHMMHNSLLHDLRPALHVQCRRVF